MSLYSSNQISKSSRKRSSHSTHPIRDVSGPTKTLHNNSVYSTATVRTTSKHKDSLSSDDEGSMAKERLTKSVKRLDAVLKDLIDYKIDASSATSTVDRLVQTLHNEKRPEQLMETVTFIRNLARNQASRHGLVRCPPLIRVLIRILQTTSDTDLQAEAALCLQLLAKTSTGAELIGDEFGIPVLVKLLGHPTEVIFTTALYLLNQLMWHLPEEMRPKVRDCRGHLALSSLLSENRLTDPNWLIICVDAIRMTVYSNNETKVSMLKTNVHEDIVRMLRTYVHNAKMTFNIARLIKVLGTCNKNKVALVEHGAVAALTNLLNSSNHAIVLEALWGLRNISDRAFHIEDTKEASSGLIPALIGLLSSYDENISICAAGCLCNLTCQNAHNKQVLVENDGVKLLCQLLNLNRDRQEITEPVCSALRHVSHRNENAASAIYEIRVSQTIPTIALLLRENNSDSTLPMVKSVVGLLRNLAVEKEARGLLKSEQVTESLLRILKQFTARVHSALVSELTNGQHLGSIEGVRLEDMLELVLLALQAMALDVEVMDQLIHTAGCLSTAVQILYLPFKSLQRASTALLSQLSTSKYGALAIEREGACSRLAEMIQSENEYIAGYSAAILHRIARDKPAEYRRRLSLELRQALFDGGLAEENVDLVATPKAVDSDRSTTLNTKTNRLSRTAGSANLEYRLSDMNL